MQPISTHEGLSQLAKRQYQLVHEQCISAIKTDVNYAPAYFLLGVVASEHSNHDKALELFAAAEKHDSHDPHYPAYRAKTLSTLRKQMDAKQAAERAAELLSKNNDQANIAHLADTIAVVLSRAGFHEEAIPLFKRAIAEQSNDANMHYNLAASAQFVGDFELASSSYLTALNIDPSLYRAWASLIYLNKQTQEVNSLNTLKKLFAQNEKNSDAALQLGHAIAKTYEDLGHFEDSLAWLHKAKKIKKEELKYDRNEGIQTFEAAKATSSNHQTPNGPNALKHKSYTQIDDQTTPIFIVGLPRTGTTLVDRILSSHSTVTSAGELNVFAELIKQAAGTASNLVLDAETLHNSKGLDLREIGNRYLEKTESLARGNNFMVDKMPLNFFYAGLIQRALPDARIIALRRGAMDSCLSNYRQLFATQYSFYNYTFDLSDTAWFYRQFDDLIQHWRSALPAERFLEVQYEDIVFDQENQTKRMLDFCDLDWQDACMNFHENAAPVSTASSVQVRQALYSGSIGRWKKYGDHINDLRIELGDLCE